MIEKNTYYPYFDYLRIILVTIVMLGHDGLSPWAHSGKLAVYVFFSLSGWLIGSILIKTEISSLPRFYFNRALRIWIPYYIALVLIIIASLIKDPIDYKWYEFIIYKVTWVYNLFGSPQIPNYAQSMPLDGTGNHFWSVNAEEQFYLLAPLFLVVFSKIGKQLLTWVCLVAILWFMGIYASISFGVLAAVINSRFPDFHIKFSSRIVLLILFLSSALGLAYTSNYQLYDPIFSVSLVLLLAVKGKRSRVGSFLGGISYPLYLNHWIGVFFFNLVLDPFGLRDSGIRQFLAVLMNYGVAAFLYWFIERKVLSMRAKIYTIKRGLVFTVLAYFLILLGLIFGVVLYPSLNHAIIFIIFIITAYFIIHCCIKEWSKGLLKN